MAEDQLFADAVRHIIHVEHALFLLHLRMEHDLKQHIAKLLLEVLGVLVVDRLADLIGLLDEVLADGMMILCPVPHAAVRRAQDLHNAQQVGYAVLVFLFKINHFRVSSLQM